MVAYAYRTAFNPLSNVTKDDDIGGTCEQILTLLFLVLQIQNGSDSGHGCEVTQRFNSDVVQDGRSYRHQSGAPHVFLSAPLSFPSLRSKYSCTALHHQFLRLPLEVPSTVQPYDAVYT